jgi:hypothetical protein
MDAQTVWSYEVVVKRGMLSKQLKDSDGAVILDEYDKPMLQKFRVKRVYLVLKNAKYNKMIVYHVSRENTSKNIPFFTNMTVAPKLKIQVLASLMGEHLKDRLGNRAHYAVMEAIDALRGG